MTKAELRQKIKTLAVQVMAEKAKTDDAALAYDKAVIKLGKPLSKLNFFRGI